MHKRMVMLTQTLRYFVVVSFLILTASVSIFAQSVAKDELESVRNASVVFINYTGPLTRTETTEEIKEIGRALGRAIRAGAQKAGYANRYLLVHSYSAAKDTGLHADILSIGVDAGVDHINNLRLIIEGYLETAYDYSENDSRLLARFITIYNAVYRGKLDYVKATYTPDVSSNLTNENTGISVRFDEWPGKTKLIIPLSTAKPGSLSAVNTGNLVDEAVTETLRTQEDRGIEERKEIVDLKERESDQARQEASAQREGIRQIEEEQKEQERKLAEEEAKLKAEQARLAQAKQEAAEAPAEEREAAQEAVAEQEKVVAEQEKLVQEQENAVTEKEETVEAAKEELAETEARATQKIEEAREERQEIAADQQALIQKEEDPLAAALASGKTGVVYRNQDSSLGYLVLLDTRSGEELKRSVVDNVVGRSVQLGEKQILTIAGENGVFRLVTIDPKSLAIQKSGEDTVSENSLLWQNGENLYAILKDGTSLKLARFNAGLERQAVSNVEVHPYCTPLFSGTTVTVQLPDGSAVQLDTGTLVKK